MLPRARGAVRGALALLTAALIGCSSGDDSEGGTTGAAKRVCSTVAGCKDLDLYVSRAECERKTEDAFGMVSMDCYECLSEVTCAGWTAISDGDKTECDFCAECCPKK